MTGVVFLIGGVLVAVALAMASQMFAGISKERNPTTPFIRKKQMLSPDELEFYQLLKKSIHKNSQLLFKVRLDDFLNLPMDSKDLIQWKQHALQLNVDYLICKSKGMIPYAAIDYKDYDSMNRKQKDQDSLKEKVLQDVGIPFICYDLNREYDTSELSEDISEAYEEFEEEFHSE